MDVMDIWIVYVFKILILLMLRLPRRKEESRYEMYMYGPATGSNTLPRLKC